MQRPLIGDCMRVKERMPGTGLEPVRGKPPQDFKSCVSASSTTPAWDTSQLPAALEADWYHFEARFTTATVRGGFARQDLPVAAISRHSGE